MIDLTVFEKKLLRLLVICGAFILSLVILFSSCISVKENEHILIKQFGKIVRVETEPGLTFKVPLIQSKQSISKSVMLYDMAASDVNTKDKKMMVADCFVIWRVENPSLYISSLGANREMAEGRLDTIVYNSLKNVISSMNQEEVISGRDGKLASAIKDNIGDSLSQYGIELLAVETKQLDLPEENKEAVYNRMISERENISAGYLAEGQEENTKIKTQTDMEIRIMIASVKAEAEKLKAEGESQYMSILSAAYNDEEKAIFYEFVRGLDMLKDGLAKDTTIILDSSSPITKFLNSEIK